MNFEISRRDMQEIVAQVAARDLGGKLGPAMAAIVDESMPAIRAGMRLLMRDYLAKALATVEIEMTSGYIDDAERDKIREKYRGAIADALAKTEGGPTP